MGFGGILASMAQGLGKGMVENVHNGWEDERIQKQLDWRADEYDKQRQFDAQESDRKFQHEKELKIMDGKTEISKAIITARANAKYGGKGGLTPNQEAYLGAQQTIAMYDKGIADRAERIKQLDPETDKAIIDSLKNEIAVLQGSKGKYMETDEALGAYRGAGALGKASYLNNGGSLDRFEGIQKPVIPTSSIGEPKVNKVDNETSTSTTNLRFLPGGRTVFFNGEQSKNFSDITNGVSNWFGVEEVKRRGHHW